MKSEVDEMNILVYCNGENEDTTLCTKKHEPIIEHRPEEVQKKMGSGEREVLGLRGILGKMGNQELICEE